MPKRLAVLAVAVLAFALAACGGGDAPSPKKQVEQRAKGFRPYLPTNGVELANYNRAQQLYDSPDTIIWCSTTWGNASAPIVTVPIAGKLTSSSTTFFQPEEPAKADFAGDGHGLEPAGGVVSARSVDGLYHPNPPKYRYGFTPGGQYVDFSEMPTFCTTALTKFQREQTEVAVSADAAVEVAQKSAERALADDDPAEAQRVLEAAIR